MRKLWHHKPMLRVQSLWILQPKKEDRLFIRHECDLLYITKSNRVHEVEIKISKADFKAEEKKEHNHDKHNCIDTFSYAVPESLVSYIKDKIPTECGIWSVGRSQTTMYRKPKSRNIKLNEIQASAVTRELYLKGYHKWAHSLFKPTT